MSKKERREALEKRLHEELSGLALADARVMLMTFIRGFELLAYRKKAKGLARTWYTLIGVFLFVDGYIRDVRVNSVSGVALFGEFAKFGTFTATLWRVKESHIEMGGGYIHPKYGRLSTDKYALAMQICEVLNDYEKDHC